MDMTTITIDQDLAWQKLREYAAMPHGRRTIEDDLLREAYRAAANGQRLINVQHAMHAVGLNEHGEPKLAMARADWTGCVFHPHVQIGQNGPGHTPGAGTFTCSRRLDARLRTNCFSVPRDTFNADLLTRTGLFSPVPYIPPELRPRPSVLNRFFVLFEVDCWQVYPVDPFLLRHIAGPFYAIEAEWELSSLEVSLLSALAS